MEIKMKEMNYVFNEEGTTEAIEVQYQSYEQGEQFTVRVIVTEGNFDEMNRTQVDQAAKAKISTWLKEEKEVNEEDAQ